MNIGRIYMGAIATSVAAAVSMPAMADGRMQVMTATPSQLQVTDSAAHTTGVAQIKGEYAKVLYGDPSKANLYTVLLYIAPHKRIQPLSHPDDGFATVLSGHWYVGFGDKYDKSKLVMLPPGGIYNEPANANHFGETRDEAVTIAITRYGPSGTTYADPADAPAK